MDHNLRSGKIPELRIRILHSAKPLNGTKVKYTTVHLCGHIKGKALVIDIWATWCGTCIGDIKQ